MLAKPVAFLQRDLGIALTYRISFVQSAAMLVVGLISMDFVARFVNEGAPPSLAEYGNDYFAFALVGAGTALFAQAVVGLFPGAVRGAQVTGTLEVILGSRTGLPAFLAGSALYGLCYALLRFCASLIIGSLILGAAIHMQQAPLAALAFLLTAFSFAGIGIFAAAFVVWFKQPEPFTGLLITLSLLLSGALYPTAVLPSWLEKLSMLLPLTHTIAVMRSALLQQEGAGAVAGELTLLALFALLLPIGVWAFAFAVRRAQAAGSLGHY
jgi:ABC-2 type transport system permease protein